MLGLISAGAVMVVAHNRGTVGEHGARIATAVGSAVVIGLAPAPLLGAGQVRTAASGGATRPGRERARVSPLPLPSTWSLTGLSPPRDC